MSFQKAINEIAGLLTQAGTPANHANDIAARLSYALESYYDSRQANSGNSDLNAASANTAAFRRAFRSAESYPGGKPGQDGAGAYAWAVGGRGKDGQDGTSGQDGFGQDGLDGGFGGGGGGGLNIGSVPCRDLKAKLQDCGIKTGSDNTSGSCDPKCCSGKFRGQSICDILEQQARNMGDCGDRGISLCNRLKELERKVEAIEKMLKDTVDC